MDPEAFFPVAKNPQIVRAAQRSDLSWLIKILGGIHHLFKQSLSQSSRHVPVSCVEKKNDTTHGKSFILSRSFEQLSAAISA